MEGVIDGTSVPMVENRPVFGPELPPSEKKDEATIETSQTRMDNESEISIEGSTVKIASSTAAEASSTLVAAASINVNFPLQISGATGAMTPSRTIFVPTEKPSPRERNLKQIEEIEDTFDDRYDSDGLRGPHWEATRNEGNQLGGDDDEDDIDDDDDDDCLREKTIQQQHMEASMDNPTVVTNGIELNTVQEIQQEGVHVPLTTQFVAKLNLNQLQIELKC